jgi:hypothetical protein
VLREVVCLLAGCLQLLMMCLQTGMTLGESVEVEELLGEILLIDWMQQAHICFDVNIK